jgi:hypothetical protein
MTGWCRRDGASYVALSKMGSINDSTKFQSEMVVPGVAVIGDINGVSADYRVAQLEHTAVDGGRVLSPGPGRRRFGALVRPLRWRGRGRRA